jgi:chromate reductase
MRLLLITGSTRRRSTNTVALHTARKLLGEDVASVYDALDELPVFDRFAVHHKPPSAVASLRDAVAEADALVFCTPEYGGRLPERFRNLLAWTAAGGMLRGKPATWLNVGDMACAADVALRALLRSVGASIMPASAVQVPVAPDDIGADGLIRDEQTLARLRHALVAIAAAA